jgi:hypothetical protein
MSDEKTILCMHACVHVWIRLETRRGNTSDRTRERFADGSTFEGRRQSPEFVSGIAGALWLKTLNHSPPEPFVCIPALPPIALLLCTWSTSLLSAELCCFCLFLFSGDNGMRRRRFRFFAPTAPTDALWSIGEATCPSANGVHPIACAISPFLHALFKIYDVFFSLFARLEDVTD